MGNRQSLTITHPETDHNEKKEKNDQPNGHAVSGLDLTDAVTCEASKPAPVTFKFNVKPIQASVETNGTKAKATTVSVEAVSATTASVEKEIPAESSTPTKDTSKPAGTPSMFNKMFKMKTGPADVAAEVAESQKSTPTSASIETNGIQAKAPSVAVDAPGLQISASTASTEKEVPTESSTPAKDTSKQAGTPSKFNMMFKKKPVAADVADETPTQVSVATNGIQAKAPSVTVDATAIQISASTASTEKEVPTETSTPAKDTSKQAGTPSKFNMMFKKKPVAADVAAEVKIVPAVQTESQKSTPTQISVATNGIQAKAPSVTVDATGIQITASTASAEKEVPTESSTPAKDTSKQAGTPSKFNMMFKKKPGAADVAAEVAESQKSTPTSASIETNGTQANIPTVSLDAAGIQISASTASTEKEVPTESSTPAKDTSKQAGTPSKFNMMFKKKPVAADVAAEVKIVPAVLTESQKSTPTQISVATNGIQAKAPSVTVDATAIQISASTASAEKEVPTESSTPAKDTSKQAGTPSKFNMMFKKKPVAADVATEVKIVPTVLTESQKSTPTQISVATNGIQAKAPSVTVDATAIQITASTASAEKEVPTESSTPAKDTSKQAGTPSKFNMMFKKKPGAADVATETPTQISVATNGIQAKAPSVTVDATGIQISASSPSAEKEVPTESSTPAKDTSKQAATPSKFNMMFKKKPGAADVAAEVAESQKSTPTSASIETNGTQANIPTVSLDAAGIQISASTASTEKEVPTESSTPAKDTSKQAGTPSKFNMMFKKKPVAADVADEIPTQVSVKNNGIQAKAPSVTVDAAGIQINATTLSAEKETPAESGTAAKDTPKQAGTPSMFNKMFKKKPGAADVAAEVTILPAEKTESQKSETVTQNIEDNKEDAEDVLSSDTDSEMMEAAEKLTLQLIASIQSDTTQNTPGDVGAGLTKAGLMDIKHPKNETDPSECSEEETWVLIESPVCAVDSAENTWLFCKLQSMCIETVGDFSCKPVSVNIHTKRGSIWIRIDVGSSMDNDTKCDDEASFDLDSVEVISLTEEEQLTTDIPGEDDEWRCEPTDIKASPQADKEPQNEALVLSTTEVTQDSTQSEQTGAEEKSVMNFFKTFVTSTKTTKEATPSPDVSKEQSQKETPPAPAANVQEASKVPPPPPPAPPKMESKAEPAVKKEQAPAVEVAAAAAKEPEAQSKAKTKDSPFSKIFRSKSEVKEEAKPVEIQVDASKASTLEVSAKPEHPPAPKPEEKKAEKKPSPFANLLKPKVLLGQVSSKIHAAASSASASISLGARGAATESKKKTPAAPTAPADAAPSTKAKEEPKQAAPAAPAATSADNKSVGSTDNSSPSTSRKLEKRNSIHLFFKNLGQKRHSDAGVQTEPVAPEKAK